MKTEATKHNNLQKRIYEALRTVHMPDGRDIVALEMISGVQVADDGQVVFLIEVDPAQGSALEPMRQKAEDAVRALDGVTKASAILTAQKNAPSIKRQSGDAGQNQAAAMDPHGMAKNPPLTLPVKNIIAVASGKGGVGKSTVAVNLAAQLAKNGYKTGLLDADIYGPSVPKLTGREGFKPEFDKDQKIIPLEQYGMKIMSIGFMVDAEKALVWRGPMVQSALYQMFRDVKWGAPDDMLDVLIVDMPPGTGDAQLTLAQKVPVSGAVIVSTPQDLALADARKGIEMFQTVNVPILGVIENMSTHICSACGHEEHLFGHGGARAEAKKLGVPFLGEIPLHMDIRISADAGQPLVFSKSVDEKINDVYSRIADKLSINV